MQKDSMRTEHTRRGMDIPGYQIELNFLTKMHYYQWVQKIQFYKIHRQIKNAQPISHTLKSKTNYRARVDIRCSKVFSSA